MPMWSGPTDLLNQPRGIGINFCQPIFGSETSFKKIEKITIESAMAELPIHYKTVRRHFAGAVKVKPTSR